MNRYIDISINRYMEISIYRYMGISIYRPGRLRLAWLIGSSVYRQGSPPALSASLAWQRSPSPSWQCQDQRHDTLVDGAASPRSCAGAAPRVGAVLGAQRAGSTSLISLIALVLLIAFRLISSVLLFSYVSYVLLVFFFQVVQNSLRSA